MDTWFERGEEDAKGAGDTLPLVGDRIIYARMGYKHWLSLYHLRKSLATYREYLKGFNSVLPFKDHAAPVTAPNGGERDV